MIKELLLVALVFITGFVVTFHFLGESITGLFSNVVVMAQGFTQPIQTMIQRLVSSVQQNPVPTLTGVGIGAAPIILIAGKAYTAVKNRLSARVQEVTEQKNIAQLQANQLTSKVEVEKAQLQEQVETLETQVKSQIDLFKAEIRAKDDIIAQQKKDLAEAIALSHIDEDSIVEKLRKTE